VGSPTALWAALALVALGGLVWSWRRSRATGRGWRSVVEKALLGTLTAGCVLLGVLAWPRPTPAPEARVAWTFEPRQRRAIISAPLVHDDRVFVGVIRDGALSSSGAVYCLDRGLGKVLWSFDAGGQMQHMYSSPCLADGRLYVGEGMHGNLTCK